MYFLTNDMLITGASKGNQENGTTPNLTAGINLISLDMKL